MSDITSRPYHPTACCEACVFNRGDHAPWCDNGRIPKHAREYAAHQTTSSTISCNAPWPALHGWSAWYANAGIEFADGDCWTVGDSPGCSVNPPHAKDEGGER